MDYECEWGGTTQLRSFDPKFVTMTDSEGKEMKCKCGKRTTFIAMGCESFIATCQDCSPYGEEKNGKRTD